MRKRGLKFEQLARLVSDLGVEQSAALRKALHPGTLSGPVEPGLFRSSPDAAATALQAVLTRNRVRAALDPADDSLDEPIDGILNAPMRDGQQITPEMWNLLLARLHALEQTCSLFTRALIEALYPSKRPVRDPFHTSKHA